MVGEEVKLYAFLISALDEGKRSASRLGCFPSPLPRGNSPQYPFDSRLGGSQSRSGRGSEGGKKYLPCPVGN